jgi:tripartite-type tricarboxylate transporter receptor subunit TctC
MEDVPTLMEQGFDIDNASVNFRGVMVPKGTPQNVIDHLAATVPAMFENGRVQSRMKAGGSPMHIMNRQEVLDMWAARQATLEELLAGL